MKYKTRITILVTVLFYVSMISCFWNLNVDNKEDNIAFPQERLLTPVTMPMATPLVRQTVTKRQKTLDEDGWGGIGRRRDVCSNMTLPRDKVVNDTWVFVDEDHTTAVFSAYFVNRSRIIVIGVGQRRLKLKFICQLWYPASNGPDWQVQETNCVVSHVGEDHGRK